MTISRRDILLLGLASVAGISVIGNVCDEDFFRSINTNYPKIKNRIDAFGYNTFRFKDTSSMYSYKPFSSTISFEQSKRKQFNIVLIDIDTLRAKTGPFGKESQMPNLENLMKRLGAIVFTNIYASSSWTIPSSISMDTGLLPHRLGTGFRYFFQKRVLQTEKTNLIKHIDSKIQTRNLETIKALQTLGYITTNFNDWFSGTHREIGVGTQLGKLGYQTHLLTANVNTLRDRREGYKVFFDTTELIDCVLKNVTAKKILSSAKDILLANNEPKLLFLNPMEMHEPREDNYNLKMNKKLEMLRKAARLSWKEIGSYGNPYTIEQQLSALGCESLYNFCANKLDEEITKFIEEIYSNPNLNANTYVIITSDHGEEFLNHREEMKKILMNLKRTDKGEYNPAGYSHGTSFSREVIKVPLAIIGPTIKKFQTLSRFGTHTDIAATMYALGGIDVEDLDGSNLLETQKKLKKIVLSEGTYSVHPGIGIVYPNGSIFQVFPFERPMNSKPYPTSFAIDPNLICYGPNPGTSYYEDQEGNLSLITRRQFERLHKDLQATYPDHPMIPNLEKIINT